MKTWASLAGKHRGFYLLTRDITMKNVLPESYPDSFLQIDKADIYLSRGSFMKRLALALILLALLAFNAYAADTPAKESMRTKAGLYVDAIETHQMITDPQGREVILIDVRDPIEIKFTGYTVMTDIHVPWKIIDSDKWDEKKQSYGGHLNGSFADEVKARLDSLAVSKDAHLIFMCRSGSTRSAPAADIFYVLGYHNVYSMVDGFEGAKAKSGAHKGARAVDGWKNANLPWGWKLEKDVMYGVKF